MSDPNNMTCEQLEAAMATATDPDRLAEYRAAYAEKGCGAQTNDDEDDLGGDSGGHGGKDPPPPPGDGG